MKIVRTKKGELEAIKSARQAPESKPRRVSRSRLNSHKKHYSSEVCLLFKKVHLPHMPLHLIECRGINLPY